LLFIYAMTTSRASEDEIYEEASAAPSPSYASSFKDATVDPGQDPPGSPFSSNLAKM
jgi:hypothetical protein